MILKKKGMEEEKCNDNFLGFKEGGALKKQRMDKKYLLGCSPWKSCRGKPNTFTRCSTVRVLPSIWAGKHLLSTGRRGLYR